MGFARMFAVLFLFLHINRDLVFFHVLSLSLVNKGRSFKTAKNNLCNRFLLLLAPKVSKMDDKLSGGVSYTSLEKLS